MEEKLENELNLDDDDFEMKDEIFYVKDEIHQDYIFDLQSEKYVLLKKEIIPGKLYYRGLW